MCSIHYTRWWKYGDPLVVKKPPGRQKGTIYKHVHDPSKCTKCGSSKPESRRSCWCSDCKSIYNKKYYEMNRETELAKKKATYKPRSEEKWAYNINRLYGITADEYFRLLEKQDGVCAICKGKESGSIRTDHFHIDHDHSCCEGQRSCGKCVRGLLCRWCNHLLGTARDNPEFLEAAITYLRDRTL